MAVELQRTYYIGIGGTGAKTLLRTKIHFKETFGHIPDCIQFLLIDPDDAPYNHQHDVGFETFEHIRGGVKNPVEVLQLNERIREWWPKGVEPTPSLDGCGQRRTNGRLIVFHNANQIFSTIERAKAALTSPSVKSRDPGAYKILPSAEVRYCMVASFGGGTGSGMTLDIARYINQNILDSEDQLIAFFFLPTLYKYFANTDHIYQNAYALFKELNFLYSGKLKDIPRIILNGQEIPSKKTLIYPFSKTIVIDSGNDIYNYSDLDDLYDIVGRCLIMAAGSLGVQAKSIWANISEGVWLGIRPNLSGMGLSEVVFNAKSAKDFAVAGLVRKLVDRVILSQVEPKESVEDRLNEWNLVETDADQLIDQIWAPKGVSQFRLPDRFSKETAEETMQGEIRHRTREEASLEDSCETGGKAILNDIRQKLREHLGATSNHPGGLINLSRFLKGCQSLMKAYRGEMLEEIKGLDRQKENALKKLDNSRKQVSEATEQWIGKAKAIEAALTTLRNANQSYLSLHVEILRRQKAVAVYDGLLDDIASDSKKVEQLTATCYLTLEMADKKLEEARRARTGKKKYVIEVGNHLGEETATKESPMRYLEDTFSGDTSFIDFFSHNVDTLYEIFRSYCENLDGVKKLTDYTLDEVLNDLSDDKLKKIIEGMEHLSRPLWKWNEALKNPGESRTTENIFLIGCGSEDNVFKRKNLLKFMPNVGKAIPQTIGIGDHTRAVCLRFEDAIPAFAIQDMENNYKNRYEHFKKMHTAMRDKDLRRIAYEIDGRWEDSLPDLFPSTERGEDLRVWALANTPIFNLISRSGNYYWASSSEASAADDYKHKLDAGRPAAFEAYLRMNDVIEEHKKKIERISSHDFGNMELASKLKDYLDSKLLKEIKKVHSKSLKALLEREIRTLREYVEEVTSEF